MMGIAKYGEVGLKPHPLTLCRPNLEGRTSVILDLYYYWSGYRSRSIIFN